MTPDRQAVERAAREYLAAYDVERTDAETWYRAVVDARNAIRAALASETPTPHETKPCVCGEPFTIGVVHRSDGPCYHPTLPPPSNRDPLAPEDHARLAASDPGPAPKPEGCPPTPAEGRGGEANVLAAWKAEPANWSTSGPSFVAGWIAHARSITPPAVDEAAIRADERDRCARVCEAKTNTYATWATKATPADVARAYCYYTIAANSCAAAIRSLPHGDGKGKERWEFYEAVDAVFAEHEGEMYATGDDALVSATLRKLACCDEAAAKWRAWKNAEALRAAERAAGEAGRDRCGPMSFGVVDCDGVLYADYRENAERRVRVLNDSGIAGTPYRVVPLYAQPASATAEGGGGKPTRYVVGQVNGAWCVVDSVATEVVARFGTYEEAHAKQLALLTALPASPVEGAREKVVEAAKAFRAHDETYLIANYENVAEEGERQRLIVNMLVAVDALIAAERAENGGDRG